MTEQDDVNGQEKLVSVVVPTCRRPRELERCLASLAQQAYRNLEVIIVNDSGAGYLQQAEVREVIIRHEGHLRIRYLENAASVGGAKARNAGIAQAKGEFICFLDDDDEFEAGKVLQQASYLGRESRHSAVYCGYRVFQGGRVVEVRSPVDCGDLRLQLLLLENSMCAGSTLMIRASALRQLRGFDEDFPRHQDWEFLMRFFAGHTIGVVAEPLVKIHRDDPRHRSNAGHVEDAKQKFLERFGPVIDSFGDELSREIRHRHYFSLARFFIYRNDWPKATRYLRRSASHRAPGISEYALVVGTVIDSKVSFFPLLKSLGLRLGVRRWQRGQGV